MFVKFLKIISILLFIFFSTILSLRLTIFYQFFEVEKNFIYHFGSDNSCDNIEQNTLDIFSDYNAYDSCLQTKKEEQALFETHDYFDKYNQTNKNSYIKATFNSAFIKDYMLIKNDFLMDLVQIYNQNKPLDEQTNISIFREALNEGTIELLNMLSWNPYIHIKSLLKV